MPSIHTTLPVALVQEPPVFLNLDASIAKAVRLIDAAARDGARLIVFPETWLPGYPVWLDESPGAAMWGSRAAEMLFRHLFDNAPSLSDDAIDALVRVATERGVDVVMGLHERVGGSLYNSMLLIDREGGRRVHRKLTPTYNERLIWAQGDGSTLGAWTRDYGVLGGLICWEHWMPLARAAMHAQGEAVHIAQWPAVGDLHQLASRHYAFEGQCFVLAAGCVLTRDDVLEGFDSLSGRGSEARAMLESISADKPFLKDGGSAVIAPDAAYVVGPVTGEKRTILADLNLARIAAGRLYLDTNGHYARPDVFELRVDARARQGVRFEGA